MCSMAQVPIQGFIFQPIGHITMGSTIKLVVPQMLHPDHIRALAAAHGRVAFQAIHQPQMAIIGSDLTLMVVMQATLAFMSK